MEFKSLGEPERKTLLQLLGVSMEDMKCEYCGKAADYKNCSILPTAKKESVNNYIVESAIKDWDIRLLPDCVIMVVRKS